METVPLVPGIVKAIAVIFRASFWNTRSVPREKSTSVSAKTSTVVAPVALTI